MAKQKNDSRLQEAYVGDFWDDRLKLSFNQMKPLVECRELKRFENKQWKNTKRFEFFDKIFAIKGLTCSLTTSCLWWLLWFSSHVIGYFLIGEHENFHKSSLFLIDTKFSFGTNLSQDLNLDQKFVDSNSMLKSKKYW